MAEPSTETIAFLFTDVEGSTRLLERFPGPMDLALALHHAVLERAITHNGGRVFETVGDAVYGAFADPARALAAAVDGQLALQASAWGETGPLRVRMALHTGPVERRGLHYFGPALFRCARLQALGYGGQILLSATTAALVRDGLPPGVTLRELGTHRLKDLAQPEQVWQALHPALAADFPPLRSSSARAPSLPAPASSFVGRRQDLEVLRERLRHPSARLVTLTGPAGVGKSRLALQAAADVADELPHGVHYVDLSTLQDPAQLMPTIASRLGLESRAPADALNGVAHLLREQAALLVLDSLEHLLPAAAALAELLADCPRLKILATSRAPLHLYGEHELAVAPLPLPSERRQPGLADLERNEAVRLFVERARAVRPGFALSERTAADVAEIVRRLDGLPLAIELAAARVKLLSPRDLLARLDERLRLLGTPTGQPSARQHTLREALEWSYALLGPAEQRLLYRLALFVGGFTLEAAEAVCGADGLDVLDGLTALVDSSLLGHAGRDEGGLRFALLNTVRAFALERLDTSGEMVPLRDAHARYYLGLAEAALAELRGPEQETWLMSLEREQDNLRLAQRWAAEGGDADASLRLGLTAILGGGRKPRRGLPDAADSAGA